MPTASILVFLAACTSREADHALAGKWMATTHYEAWTGSDGCDFESDAVGERHFPFDLLITSLGDVLVTEAELYTTLTAYAGQTSGTAFVAHNGYTRESSTGAQQQWVRQVEGDLADDHLSGRFIDTQVETDENGDVYYDCRTEVPYEAARLEEPPPRSDADSAFDGAWLATMDLAYSLSGPACPGETDLYTYQGSVPYLLEVSAFDDGGAAVVLNRRDGLVGTASDESLEVSESASWTSETWYGDIEDHTERVRLAANIRDDGAEGSYERYERVVVDGEDTRDCTTSYPLRLESIVVGL